jgi:hypothetical protein
MPRKFQSMSKEMKRIDSESNAMTTYFRIVDDDLDDDSLTMAEKIPDFLSDSNDIKKSFNGEARPLLF